MSLAKSIRALERDTYDLAGSGGAGLSELLSCAFSTPLEASEPLRITLVVGGGKKVRGSYGETLMRDVCTALEKVSPKQKPLAAPQRSSPHTPAWLQRRPRRQRKQGVSRALQAPARHGQGARFCGVRRVHELTGLLRLSLSLVPRHRT